MLQPRAPPRSHAVFVEIFIEDGHVASIVNPSCPQETLTWSRPQEGVSAQHNRHLALLPVACRSRRKREPSWNAAGAQRVIDVSRVTMTFVVRSRNARSASSQDATSAATGVGSSRPEATRSRISEICRCALLMPVQRLVPSRYICINGIGVLAR